MYFMYHVVFIIHVILQILNSTNYPDISYISKTKEPERNREKTIFNFNLNTLLKTIK